MTANDSRQRSRRQQERRVKERRAADYPFGSPEWIKRVQQDNYLWPKEDRRSNDRRRQERRQNPRRVKNVHKTMTGKNLSSHNLLTREEKQMLNELMRQNDNE